MQVDQAALQSDLAELDTFITNLITGEAQPDVSEYTEVFSVKGACSGSNDL